MINKRKDKGLCTGSKPLCSRVSASLRTRRRSTGPDSSPASAKTSFSDARDSVDRSLTPPRTDPRNTLIVVCIQTRDMITGDTRSAIGRKRGKEPAYYNLAISLHSNGIHIIVGVGI